jgi:hypothetical protein
MLVFTDSDSRPMSLGRGPFPCCIPGSHGNVVLGARRQAPDGVRNLFSGWKVVGLVVGVPPNDENL